MDKQKHIEVLKRSVAAQRAALTIWTQDKAPLGWNKARDELGHALQKLGITQSMARELGPHGINVNAVCPGVVDTYRMDLHGRGERWEQMASNAPIGRNGTDDEVGAFCAYLCTEAASWIHGQSININGGTIMEH